MKIIRKNLPQSQVELLVELNAEDIHPHLIETAKHISQQLNIPGFRPGKAPYDMVKRQIGEEKIFQDGLDDIINGSLIKAMQQENVYPYGEPQLKLDKISPLTEVVFTVTMDAYPDVKLGVWPTDKIKLEPVKVEQTEIEQAIQDLARMLVREEPVERAAQKGDGALIDFDVLVNGVPIEGGSSKDFNIVIGDGKMIPGFEDKLVGLKAGDNLDFKLNFPADYKADLANKEAEFKVGMKQVFARTVPEIDDELAKRLGVSNKKELVEKIEENLKKEKQDKVMQRAEIDAVKKIVEVATIGELPPKMIKDETQRLLHEFEHDLAHQRIDMQTYLGSVGKTAADLEKEFEPKAIERLQTSLVVDEVSNQEKIEVSPKEIDTELDKQRQYYTGQPNILSDLEKPEYRRQLANRMLKVRTVEMITDRLVEK
jgi:trigger factor